MKHRIVSLLSIISLGAMPMAWAASSASGTLLVLNKSDDTVSMIDLGTHEVIATLPTGDAPHEVAVSPDGKLAVVANYGAQTPGNTLTLIDVPAKRVTRTIDLGEYRKPHGVAWLKGSEVAVTVEANKALLIVDVSNGKVQHAVETGQEVSHMVALSGKHSRAFVANIGSGSVTAIDLTSHERLANIPTGAGAEGIDVSPDGSEVWVTNRGANTVSVLDAGSLQVKATLPSGGIPIRAKFTPDGKQVLVSNAQSGDVGVYDAATKKELARIPMQVKAAEGGKEQRVFGNQFGQGPVPVGILMAAGVPVAFVANTNADIVSVLDLKTRQVVDRLKAGREPDGLGYSPLSVR